MGFTARPQPDGLEAHRRLHSKISRNVPTWGREDPRGRCSRAETGLGGARAQAPAQGANLNPNPYLPYGTRGEPMRFKAPETGALNRIGFRRARIMAATIPRAGVARARRRSTPEGSRSPRLPACSSRVRSAISSRVRLAVSSRGRPAVSSRVRPAVSSRGRRVVLTSFDIDWLAGA